MEQEKRIQALEEEVKNLKLEIGRTLLEIQKTLPEKPNAPMRWEKKAWVLALLNLLLAVVLFTNIYIYIPGNPLSEINPTLTGWLRALWVALAFIWLLLQMYPLALLLEQEDRQWRGVVWRNALGFFRDRPGLLVLATLVVLVIALIDTIMPVVWVMLALVLLIVVVSVAAQNMLIALRNRSGE
ncbi:MAG: hypothetical protein HZB51_04090 [Chloroflexi bacterium]|nr:hypothetical protein [Chloroflexota bacterium]